MNEVSIFENQKMTSLEIAEVTGKQHKDVMRAIRNMEPAWMNVNGRNFSLVNYTDKKGELRPCYSLTKTECLYVATKFNDEARAKLVLRWEELEKKERANVISLPDFRDPAAAARAWASEYEQKTVLAIENKRLETENTLLVAENQELKHDQELSGHHHALEGVAHHLADCTGLWHERQGSEQTVGRDARSVSSERPVDIVR